jgi:hypothetical protein
VNGSESLLAYGSTTVNYNTYYILEARWISTSLVKCYVDDVLKVTQTTSLPTWTTGREGTRWSDPNKTNYQYTDWILIRKCVDPEPSHGSWGSEETPSAGQLYEIYVDAVAQMLASPAEECTFNVVKYAAVTSQSLTASKTTFNIEKEILVETLSEVVVEKVVGQIFEIFKDAITQASASSQIFGVYPVNVEGLVKASAMPILKQTLGISKDAVAAAVSTLLTQSVFDISPEATIKVLAEVNVIKPTEVKVTRLFLIFGDLAIQIQGE